MRVPAALLCARQLADDLCTRTRRSRERKGKETRIKKNGEEKKREKEGIIVAALSVLESPKLSLILAEDAIKT